LFILAFPRIWDFRVNLLFAACRIDHPIEARVRPWSTSILGKFYVHILYHNPADSFLAVFLSAIVFRGDVGVLVHNDGISRDIMENKWCESPLRIAFTFGKAAYKIKNFISIHSYPFKATLRGSRSASA
jgi:hypothetical protein